MQQAIKKIRLTSFNYWPFNSNKIFFWLKDHMEARRHQLSYPYVLEQENYPMEKVMNHILPKSFH